MTVNGIGTGSATGALYDISQLLLSQGTTSITSGLGTTSAVNDVGDSARISGPGKLLGELQQLRSQDPTKFKEVTADIASQIRTAASQATGGAADFLNNLADRFQSASSTGSATGLAPAHHHHHHTGAYNQSGQAVPASVETSPTSGADLQQLFDSISATVTQALGA
ncbi:Uncharacterized protein OS=Desulfovibrio sp. U5L GN=DesU5LDRAFT_2834 PE=4 SV=1 [Gemmata massiliana]|uniref:Uncharacterized protein n=2 Tax=Gemmata massiliana TaxID=1210884 RepID=A0A6P2D1J5_9BACT|nr:Uncharacterized protein OS=Desulfovibrio sp. U5L GN=DesU5LDRAFT_2834 PE=4 SV=1 [Gemmata massiliana]